MFRSELLEYAADNSGNGETDKDDRVIVRAAEEGLQDLESEHLWSHYRETIRLNTRSPDSTGTVSLDPIGRVLVTGAGTAFRPDNVDDLFIVNGENFFHFIESVDDGAQTLTLRDQYQNLTATTFAAASTYEILNYDYLLPSDTRRVEAVVDVERSIPLDQVRIREIMRLYADSSFTGRPEKYAIRNVVNSSGEEEVRMMIWPAPDQNHILEITRDRHIAAFPAAASPETVHIDVPPYLMRLYKAFVLWRLASNDRRWENIQATAAADMQQNLKRALKEESKHRPDITVGADLSAQIPIDRNWNRRITGL